MKKLTKPTPTLRNLGPVWFLYWSPMINAAKLETLHQKFIRLFAHIPRLKLNEPEQLFATQTAQIYICFLYVWGCEAKEIVDRPSR